MLIYLLFTIISSKLQLLYEREFYLLFFHLNCGFYLRKYNIVWHSHPELFYKKSVLKNLAKFTGKHLGQNLLINVGLNFFLRTTLLWTTCKWLFLHITRLISTWKIFACTQFCSFILFNYVRSMKTKKLYNFKWNSSWFLTINYSLGSPSYLYTNTISFVKMFMERDKCIFQLCNMQVSAQQCWISFEPAVISVMCNYVIYLVFMFFSSKENLVCVSWIDSTLWTTCNKRWI